MPETLTVSTDWVGVFSTSRAVDQSELWTFSSMIEWVYFLLSGSLMPGD